MGYNINAYNSSLIAPKHGICTSKCHIPCLPPCNHHHSAVNYCLHLHNLLHALLLVNFMSHFYFGAHLSSALQHRSVNTSVQHYNIDCQQRTMCICSGTLILVLDGKDRYFRGNFQSKVFSTSSLSAMGMTKS